MTSSANQAVSEYPGAITGPGDRARWLWIVLITYAVVIASITFVHLRAIVPNDFELMPMRADGVQSAIHVLDQGGPPLLADTNNISFPRINGKATYTYYPLPQSDDPGLYLFGSLAGHVFGTDDPRLIVKWAFVALFTLLAAIYPPVFFVATRSLLASLAVPLIVLFWIVPKLEMDIYWVPAWAVLFCLPAILALRRHRLNGWAIAGYAATLFLAGFASSIRGHAGLPAALAALVAILATRATRMRRALATLVALAAFAIVTPVGIEIARAVRSHEVHARHLKRAVAPDLAPTPTGWHVLYIGLGYLKNPYHIVYSDTSAYLAAKRVDPKVVYLSPHYRAIMRHLYLNMVVHHPGFVARTYLAKAQAELRDAWSRYWPGLLLAAGAVLAGRRMRSRRADLLLAGIAGAVTFLPGLASEPNPQSFELGWIGGAGLVFLLGIAWLLASAEGVWIESIRNRTLALRLPKSFVPEVRRVGASPTTWLMAAFVAASVVLLVGPLAHTIDGWRGTPNAADFYRAATTATAQPPAQAEVIEHWSASELRTAWTVFSGVGVAGGPDTVTLSTTTGRYVYQLESPEIMLPAGTYEAYVAGSVLSGGLELGVLDADHNAWIATTNFWSGEQYDAGHVMPNVFTLSRPTRVRVILTNFRPADGVSHWTLRSVSLVRL